MTHELNKIEKLEREAAEGESDKTPLIVFADVWVACAIGVLIALALALAAYRLAGM